MAEHRNAAASLERGERDFGESRISQLEERLVELLATVRKKTASNRDRMGSGRSTFANIQ